MGLMEYAENVFDEMSVRGACSDGLSFKCMVIGYCRKGTVMEVDRCLSRMIERGFVLDNASFTLIVSVFCVKGFVSRAS